MKYYEQEEDRQYGDGCGCMKAIIQGAAVILFIWAVIEVITGTKY